MARSDAKRLEKSAGEEMSGIGSQGGTIGTGGRKVVMGGKAEATGGKDIGVVRAKLRGSSLEPERRRRRTER